MTILYYDCFCGISGKMNLGALIDLGVDKEYLENELAKLKLACEYQLQFTKTVRNGISGTKLDVTLAGTNQHSKLTFQDIESVIKASSLNDNVKRSSLTMFRKVAEAKAAAHGKPVSEVLFSGIGATEALIDLVGAAICLDYLRVDRILASSVQLGGGFVQGEQGVMPVPAPATVRILQGVPVKAGLAARETTTPAGAAILAANVEMFTDKFDFCIEEIGYGLGEEDLDIPNVLRVYLGKAENGGQGEEERENQYILETNIDDMNPEIYGYIEEKLFAKGALDVYKTAIWMKKSRPAIKLSILIKEKQEKDMLEVIFRETTALGVRKYLVEKIMLRRDFTQVKTRYGDVTVKNAYYQGKLIKYKPEYDDCKTIAHKNNLPIAKVYREVYKLIEENEE